MKIGSRIKKIIAKIKRMPNLSEHRLSECRLTGLDFYVIWFSYISVIYECMCVCAIYCLIQPFCNK